MPNLTEKVFPYLTEDATLQHHYKDQFVNAVWGK